MRTTVDVPDYLYRELKARAALGGLRVRELITRYLEEGLRMTQPTETAVARSQPPVAVPATGKPIRALSRTELAQADEELERDRRPRSTRR